MVALTQKRLKEVASYDSDTGKFFRKIATCNSVKVGDEIGHINDNGYRMATIDRNIHRSHHLVWLYVYGKWPEDHMDHINGVRDDNRIENLRIASAQENQKNIKRPKTNTSGFMGVHWHKESGKWRVRCRSNGSYVHGGMFENIKDAVSRRNELYKELGFHKNHGRVAI